MKFFYVRKKECCFKIFFIVQSLFFYRSWSRSRSRLKKYSEPEPVKIGPAPQHWFSITSTSSMSCIFSISSISTFCFFPYSLPLAFSVSSLFSF